MRTIKSSVFIDSSVWIAFVSEEDSLHKQALSLMSHLKKEEYLFTTSFFILTETVTKLRLKYGQKDALLFFNGIKKQKQRKEIFLIPITWRDIENSTKLMERYPTPNTFSHTDANCLVLMKKHSVNAIATFDKDFKKFGVKVLP